MDDGPTYEPGAGYCPWGQRGVGGWCGCLGAALFAIPTGGFVLLAATLGECAGDPHCAHSKTMLMAQGAAIVLALAAAFGLAIRVLVRWSRLRGTDSAPRAWAVALAIPLVLALGWIALWCAWQFAG